MKIVKAFLGLSMIFALGFMSGCATQDDRPPVQRSGQFVGTVETYQGDYYLYRQGQPRYRLTSPNLDFMGYEGQSVRIRGTVVSGSDDETGVHTLKVYSIHSP